MDNARLLSLAAVAASVLLLANAISWRRRRKSAEDLERERRDALVRTGRITDGAVIEVHEEPAGPGGFDSQSIVYAYDVGGVSYHASQDVTWLRHLVDLHACRINLPCSVKYDPQNPGNSIVVSHDWSGLRPR
jgi:hypothetical protein